MGDRTRAAAICLVGLGLADCAAAAAFECESSAQCTGGQCEPNGFCSFPDGACDSGKRFGDAAPAPVGGACVPLEEAGTGSTGSTPASTDTTGGASVDEGSTGPAILDGTTTDGTTGDAESTDGRGASSGSTGATDDDGTSSGGMSGPPVPDDLLDDFDRPDDTEIGAGWIEKRPQSWQLVDGRIAFESSGSGYQDNIVYRPFAEAERDVEVSLEFELLAQDPNNHPQVHVRLQPYDLDLDGSMTGYILYIEEDNLRITRQIMGSFDNNVAVALPGLLEVGVPYRLTLSALGQDPVHLEGRLHAWQDGAWQLVGENIHDDSSPNQIVEPGTMGFSGADGDQLHNFVYDDFTLLSLEP